MARQSTCPLDHPRQQPSAAPRRGPRPQPCATRRRRLTGRKIGTGRAGPLAVAVAIVLAALVGPAAAQVAGGVPGSPLPGDVPRAVADFEDAPPLWIIGSGSNDGKSDLYRVDLATLASVIVGEASQRFADVAIHQDGRMYGIKENDGELWQIDPGTGVATLVGDTGLSAATPTALVFSPTGVLYTWGRNLNLYTLDPVTAAATPIGNTGFSSSGDLAFARDGTMYGTAYNVSGTEALVTIDPLTAAAGLVGLLNQDDMWGLEVTPQGEMIIGQGSADGNTTRLWQVDPANADLTLIGDIPGLPAGIGLNGISFRPPQIFADDFELGDLSRWTATVPAE